jgi:two-component system, OmpR family, sensor histidine kinase RstB
MHSIFFRIYVGIFFTLVSISILIYIFLQLINEHRLNQYIYNVANGTMTLITEGISRHEGIKKKEWVNIIEKLSGLNLKLSDDLPKWISDKDKLKLSQNKLIIKANVQLKNAELIVKVPNSSRQFIRTIIEGYDEKLARVAAQLILNDLGRYPITERKQRLKLIQKKFGFPVNLLNINTIKLDYLHLRRIHKGEVVVTISDTTHEPFFKVYAIFGNSGLLLSLGPIPIFDWFPPNIIILLTFFGLISLAIGSYFLVRPLENRLQQMEKEISKVGTELLPSIPIKGDDAISRFAHGLNQMALRIKTLLDEQRELTHAISHELRTPVARVKFRLANLSNKVHQNPEVDKIIRDINFDMDEINKLTDEILTFFGLQANNQNNTSVRFNVLHQLEKIIYDTQLLHSYLHINLFVNAESQQATGVEHLIKRAIQNLINNAAQYAKITIDVKIDISKTEIRICISDDGPGIVEKNWEKIFSPFTRLDKSRNRASGGYGLGLPIVKQIMELHQGNVTVSESKYKGSSFCIQWPVVQQVIKKS